MPARAQQPRARTSSKAASAAQRRMAEAQARAAADQRRRRTRMTGAVVVVAAVLTGVMILAVRATGGSGTRSAGSWPVVGGDLHTVFARGTALYVGGHDAVAVSHDAGRHFSTVPSLGGADAMGWASSGSTVLAGGHPGLYRSTDGGATFTRTTGDAAVPDVHALGSAGNAVYLASPAAGLLASADGGATWQVRNAQPGRSFMGTMLVDPSNHARLIAPDMSAGLSTSSDGGRTWKALGGPAGAMAVAWNPADVREILAVGMDGAAMTSDGGVTWRTISVPAGTTAVTYDPAGRTIYAGALDGQQAHIYRSTDSARTWTPTA